MPYELTLSCGHVRYSDFCRIYRYNRPLTKYFYHMTKCKTCNIPKAIIQIKHVDTINTLNGVYLG